MIRKLLRRVFKRTEPAAPAELAIIPVERHGLHREQLACRQKGVQCSPGARSHRLRRGWRGAGPARRSDAQGFRRRHECHARTGPRELQAVAHHRPSLQDRSRHEWPETIEVSTFRAGQNAESTETDEHGRILRDNVFGNQREDATRRDFTVNALYFDPTDETIHDYHHGVADLQQKTLRMIGDPRTAIARIP